MIQHVHHHDLEVLQRAAAGIRSRGIPSPRIGLVLGSGLGDLADSVEDPVIVETASIEGYPSGTVQGHAGRLVFGRFEGKTVVFVQGRVHYYEGHTLRSVVYPVWLLHALGVSHLLVTNAAGGIDPSFRPGTLMLIEAHINLSQTGPIPGSTTPMSSVPETAGWIHRGPDPYDPEWLEQAERVARDRGIPVRRGVYLWTAGPSYETKAEIRMFARLGASAVGMSTVPEVIVAHRLGMRVLGLSTITNPAAGLGLTPLNHEEVLLVGRQVRRELEGIVRGIVKETI